MGAVFYMLLFLAQFSSIYSSLPKVYFKCHITDSACFTKLMQLNVPAIASGIQELGTEVLDPMVIDDFNVNIAGLEMNICNVISRGIKNGVIDSANVDPDSKLLTILYHVDLNDKGSYKSSGNLLGFPFVGEGSKSFQLKNLQVELIIPFTIVTGQNGKDVIELKNFQYLFDVEGVQPQFSNLSYENQKQRDTLNRFVNNNGRLIMLLYGRPYLDAVNEKIFNAMRTYFLTLPIEDLFYEY